MSEVTPVVPVGREPVRVPLVVAWVLALIGVTHFLQWTVVLPSDVQGLFGFRRGDLEVARWWSAVTYPLVHPDSAILLLNAYTLAVFGTRLERTWGTRRFVAFLVLAAMGGWAAHLFIGGTNVLLGASSLALAVLVAHGLRWGGEEHRMAGGFRAKSGWVVFFVASLLLLVGLRATAGGGLAFLAHVGGVGAAWLFVRATPVLLVERFREGVSALPDDPPDDQPPRAVPKTLPRSRARDRETIDDVVARTNAAPARRTPTKRRSEPKTAAPPPSMDMILDKISAEGIEQLTEEERRVLDDYSRRMRDR